MYVCKYKYTRTYGGKSFQGHRVLAACEAGQQPGRGHKLCPAVRTAVSVTSLKLQRAFHTIPCASPTLCRATQPAQDSQVSSQDSFSTSLQHIHAVSKGQPSKNCSSRGYYPSPTPKPKQTSSLVPTLSFKQCLSHSKLLMPLCPLDHSFQLRAGLQEPVFSKTLNCYCLMRAVRSHHTKKSGHQRKFQKWPQLSAFWRCLHLLTPSLGIRCPMLSAGLSSIQPTSFLFPSTCHLDAEPEAKEVPLPFASGIKFAPLLKIS